jgi:hypothetical protein
MALLPKYSPKFESQHIFYLHIFVLRLFVSSKHGLTGRFQAPGTIHLFPCKCPKVATVLLWIEFQGTFFSKFTFGTRLLIVINNVISLSCIVSSGHMNVRVSFSIFHAFLPGLGFTRELNHQHLH